MPPSQHDLLHLSSLIEAARSQAGKSGPELASVGRLLDEALATLRELQASGGKPDEGLRPDELNTENDK
jgi:hypothetical protein